LHPGIKDNKVCSMSESGFIIIMLC
jgi:hypothetical protein